MIGNSLRQATFAIATASLGLALDRLLVSDEKVVWLVLALCAASSLTVLILYKNQNESILSTLRGLADESRSARAATGSLTSRLDVLEGSVASLIESIGLDVHIQLVEDLNQDGLLPEDRVAATITTAAKSVRILDLRVPSAQEDEHFSEPVKMRIFDGLDRLSTRSGGFEYSRICQVPDLASPFNGIRNQRFIDHVEFMRLQGAANRDARNTTPKVWVAAIAFPYRFTLVDDEIVILQLDRMSSRGLAIRDCELIVRDPQRTLLPAFERMWDLVLRDSSTRPVEAHDLRGPISDQAQVKPDRQDEGAGRGDPLEGPVYNTRGPMDWVKQLLKRARR